MPKEKAPADTANKIIVGVSACLLGEKVRFDGGHKHDRYITDTLGNYFSFVGVCPEVESGMSIPRESMRLEGNPAEPRLVTGKSRIDKTDQMQSFCRRRVKELAAEDLCGFIFKKDSPSSGLYRVKVYVNGSPSAAGSGLFAAAFVKAFPLMPVEEEGRLNDPDIRENFIERVFGYRRLKNMLERGPTAGRLVTFHTAHKLQMMAHSNVLYRSMGALVAHVKGRKLAEVLSEYETMYMHTLAQPATVKKNTNVLMHIMGYFKKVLSAGEKAELLDVIDDYHARLVPLVVPMTLLRHYIRKFDDHYLAGQTYLAPHPAELMLRNHV
ncbi:MAG: DUF523 and DUF1722 domain-containing protein [Spirochaetes bacterium]|nr:DUF523 and DUF1722 domain-containing protein [Spirochaetota bacterium]